MIIALHGFPANSRSWSRVTPALVDAGYRVLAPNQRGYSPGARPLARRDYRLGALVDDAVALADAAGVDRFAVAGHDWGAVVAWGLAAHYPDRISSLAALSVPHPRAMRKAMAGVQLARSSYMAFFQLPDLPEWLAVRGAGTILRLSGLDAEMADHYTGSLRGPLDWRAALNWYRAMAVSTDMGQVGAVRVPSLFVWSTKDPAIGRRSAEGCADWVTAPYRFEMIEGASHWLPETRPRRVAGLLLDHLASYP